MRYQSAAYLALTDVIGEAPGTSAKWGLIAQDGAYSAVAGTGIDLTGVERTENRVDAINAQSDDSHYPTAGAVYDYAAPKSGLSYLNNQLNQLTNEVNQKANASDIPDVTGKADKSDTYTKTEVDNKLAEKADSSDIPDISGKADKSATYTKTEVDAAIQAAIGSIETQLSQV